MQSSFRMVIQLEIIKGRNFYFNALELATKIFSPFLAPSVIVTCFILLSRPLVVVNPLNYDHLWMYLFLLLDFEVLVLYIFVQLVPKIVPDMQLELNSIFLKQKVLNRVHHSHVLLICVLNKKILSSPLRILFASHSLQYGGTIRRGTLVLSEHNSMW